MRLFTIDQPFDSMSFNYHTRKVRDSALPIAHRYSALFSCVTRLSWLVKQPYGRLCSYFQLQVQEPMTEAQLLDRLTAIEVFRNRFLEKLRDFDRKRLRQKFKGRRQPGKKAVQALYKIEALEKPLRSADSMSSV
jgi:hypothetical protein